MTVYYSIYSSVGKTTELKNLSYGTVTKNDLTRSPSVFLTLPRLKVVLIPWVEQFGDKHSQEPEAVVLARKQLYVAMTRAQNELQLFSCSGVPLIDELVQSQCLEVLSLVADDF